MISNHSPQVARRRGMSLLELTVVLVVLMSLTGMFFVSSRIWKRGADRAECLLTLRNVQVAARSYQNLYGYSSGERMEPSQGAQNIALQLYTRGYLEEKQFRQSQGEIACSGGGFYSCPLPDTFPPVGELYLRCSLEAEQEHVPLEHAEW